MDSGATLPDTPDQPRRWSDDARRVWKIWRNYYPSYAYVFESPHTVDIPLERAAAMAGISRKNFYYHYLRTGRLEYRVRTWFHGRKMRRKAFIARNAVLELLAREYCEAARLQMARRRPRPLAIARKATVADLERELEQRATTRRKSLQPDRLG